MKIFFFLRFFFLFLFFQFFFSVSFAFPLWLGKTPVDKKPILIYKEYNPNVKAMMFVFENISKEKSIENYGTDFAKILMRQLISITNLNYEIKTQKIEKNMNLYDKVTVSIKDEAYLSNRTFTNSYYSEKMAYTITNQKENEMDIYLKKENYLYIDAHNLDSTLESYTKKLTNFTIERDENGFKYFLRKNKINKPVTWQKEIEKIDYRNLLSFVEKSDKDIFFYGKYKKNRSKTGFDVTVYLIKKSDKTIQNFYQKEISFFSLQADLRKMSIYIKAKLMGKKIYRKNYYTSKPKGALIYLDDQFIGKTPFERKDEIGDKYEIKAVMPQYILSKAKSSMIEQKVEIQKARFKTNYFIHITNSSQTNSFTFKKNEKTEKFLVNVKNKTKVDLYLGEELISVNSNFYQSSLDAGQYFLIAENKKMNVRRKIQFEIYPNHNLNLNFEIKKKQFGILDFIFDHPRNVILLSTLGFFSGGFGIYSMAQSRKYEDSIEGDKFNESFEFSDNYSKYLKDNRSTNLRRAENLLATSILSFLLTGISYMNHVIDLSGDIETVFRHEGDLQFQYSKKF